MFDKELFYSLCDRYNVELSDKYECAMIKDGEDLRKLNENEVKKVFFSFQTVFSYEGSEIKTTAKHLPYFDYSDYPIAC